VAKRSPILGYNHNVKYRGLIFHVQTEDSGLLSPHLFTHLFYGGVIISTRKLVYDAGSAEDAIKGLMQSQHKIVLKDLKGGKFDDKIDLYLAGTEGLEPRTATAGPPQPVDDGPRPSDPEIVLSRPETDHDIEPMDIELAPSQAPAVARTATPPPIPQRAPTPPSGQRAVTPSSSGVPVPRTQTAERKSAPTAVRTNLAPPPPDMSELDPPTDPDASEAMHAAMQNATVRTPMPDFDSAPEIQILQNDDSAVARTRSKHDTEISDGIPGSNAPAQDKRPNALAAGALPPARPISRPPSRQAISPPAVMSRPLTNSDGERSRSESDAIEVYAPAPPSVDPPPGMQERPGQYAQHKRVSQKMSVDVLKAERERSGSVPIPAGLARPGRTAQPSSPPSPGVPQRVTREPSPGSGPRAAAPTAAERPPERPRTPTPARISPPSANVRAPSSSGSGGVVMTRPAVIVGAPAKPASTPPRVRKAREEEGRGFGQGLISEKSLDEVILAYLSEDADEK
jgi:hypothetical protein